MEDVYLNYMSDAANSPQVLRIKQSLRLDVVPDYHKRIVSNPDISLE